MCTFATNLKIIMCFPLKIVREFPITTLIILVIWVICLIQIPKTPLSGLTLIDKWTHIAMYFALSLIIAFERWRNQRSKSYLAQFIFIFLLPALMGGLLEIIQATATGGRRSGEWLDFVADAIGSAIALFICILLAKCRARA